MEIVWLGLGSNLGDSVGYIDRAVRLLAESLSEPALSPLWRSLARYVEDQPDFVNAVLTGRTEFSPQELLSFANRIENALGRDRKAVVNKGPRTIDIDILLYGNKIITEPNLIIPHPGLRERKFVLLPLLNLAPRIIDPVSGIPFADYYSMLPAQGIYPIGSSHYDAVYP